MAQTRLTVSRLHDFQYMIVSFRDQMEWYENEAKDRLDLQDLVGFKNCRIFTLGLCFSVRVGVSIPPRLALATVLL